MLLVLLEHVSSGRSVEEQIASTHHRHVLRRAADVISNGCRHMLICERCWHDGAPQLDVNKALAAVQGQALARDGSPRHQHILQAAAEQHNLTSWCKAEPFVASLLQERHCDWSVDHIPP